MDQLFAYVGNDVNLLSCALHQVETPLSKMFNGGASGWGMGYEQESQYLLRKRPQLLNEGLDVHSAVGDLRTQTLMMYRRSRERRQAVPSEMQPFRFRSWLFGQVGDLGDYNKDELLPDFLKRNIRGSTGSEHLFHRFLYYLKQERVPLHHPVTPSGPTLTALSKTMSDVRAWSIETGRESLKLGVVLINGRSIYAANIGERLSVIKQRGVSSCPICGEQPLFSGHRPKRADHTHLRAAMVFSGGVDGGEEIADGDVIGVDVDLEMRRLEVGEVC